LFNSAMRDGRTRTATVIPVDMFLKLSNFNLNDG
jgi:hypothetical protein